MNADCCTAGWASEFLFLSTEEFLHSMIPNEIQILDYAHVVFLGVSLLKFQKMLTRIICTFKTELYLIFVNEFAVLL